MDANYTPVGGVGSLAYARRGDSYQVPHKDHLGGTRELTDASEVAIQYYEYDAFGTKLEDTGGQTNRFQFAANYMKLKDHDNIYLSPTRVYHAALGRFLQKDPLISDLNLYTYAMNNPLDTADPTGKFNWAVFKECIGHIAAEYRNEIVELAVLCMATGISPFNPVCISFVGLVGCIGLTCLLEQLLEEAGGGNKKEEESPGLWGAGGQSPEGYPIPAT